ncbi:hypothetical protein NDU88_002533 [Pleurodeles waltl]|uniref:Uncharacterized protein n=1 Tax=Pleurodeles waltl TaxID=8319 RepID=A0AAV7WQI8_PLEWA|nr:hypothetical protein NDU88_002533 [Pleurodeles waltl]
MAGAGNPPGRKSGRGGKKLPLGGASQSERTPAPVKGRPACLLRRPGRPGPSGRWHGWANSDFCLHSRVL